MRANCLGNAPVSAKWRSTEKTVSSVFRAEPTFGGPHRHLSGPTVCQAALPRAWKSRQDRGCRRPLSREPCGRRYADRIVSIDQVETIQRKREGPVEPFDFFRLDLATPEQPINRHSVVPAHECEDTIGNCRRQESPVEGILLAASVLRSGSP